MCKRNQSFNAFTLYPETIEDRDNFWEFRCRDISRMFYVSIAFYLVWIIQYAFDAIDNPESTSLSQTIALVVALIVGAVFLFGKKYLRGH